MTSRFIVRPLGLSDGSTVTLDAKSQVHLAFIRRCSRPPTRRNRTGGRISTI